MMSVKELLMNGSSFLLLLKQYAIDIADVRIKDEQVLNDQFLQHPEQHKESVWIEGKTKDGVISFFGTLHYNLLEKLAVFEMQGLERTPAAELN
ncbi:hypothetical protein [Pedobacter antarcticus]|uniref:hypothetical protein n=1 Tax=Pedobacter antarcticus TaxID=34086 RepID=UPI00292F318C|nr:hypothetical protein [Pedobacter antarcticus]